MAVVRPSGVTVATLGSVQLGLPVSRTKRRGAQRSAAVQPVDGGALLAELKRQDMALVDAVPLVKKPQPVKRGAASRAAVALDVPLGPDEEAVILLEEEGEYRWIVQGRRIEAPAARTKRGGVRRGAAGASKQFAIELQVGGAKPRAVKRGGRVKRNWFVEKVAEKAVAYVFRFVVRIAGKPIVNFLERNVSTGLIAIRGPELTDWQALDDDAPLPQALPKDRAARVLLLVHGTFSSTVGSFGALTTFQEGRDFLAGALAGYDAVLGFDHKTLSVDPAHNAQEILDRLRSIRWAQSPQIDFVAFSRGGLVARSLVEQLLPQSGWRIKLGPMVFVGCTNAGTQLAEPENWHRFVDHYTNFALGAVRALALIPGAQAYTTIAGHAIRGVGGFIKALATGAVTDKVVPGLAAMEPDGPFVTAINQSTQGQVVAADAMFYAITSNFEPSKAAKDGSTPELPTPLLMRIADWGADELYREDNDLVVHVASMTEIDPGGDEFVKEKLEYGTNSTVYHTNYFAQSRTAKQLVKWFALPAVAAKAAAVKRGVKRGVRRSGPATPVVTKSDPRAVSALSEAEELLEQPTEQIALGVDDGGGRKPDLDLALSEAETVKPLGPGKPAPRKSKAPVKRGRAPKRMPTKKKGGGGGGRRARVHYAPIIRAPSGRGSLPHTPRSPATATRSPARSAPIKRRSIKRSAKRKPARAPARPDSGGSGRPDAARKVECHFLAQMDSQLQVKVAASVDVTISREEIEAAVGKETARGKAKVDAREKLIVEVIEHKQLRVDDKRRKEVVVPTPGKPATVKFKVVGERVGDGELSVQIRQKSVPLATLVLKPKIVAKLAADVPPLKQEFDLAEFPQSAAQLDELRIVENVIGDEVRYLFMLDLRSLDEREQFLSEPIDGPRDAYVVQLMNEIGESWIRNQDDVQLFEDDIRAIGGRMFDQLFPARMQQLLWKHRDNIKSVQVFSQEPFIPWELIYLKDPDTGVVEPGNKFLGELGLLRWLYIGFPPDRLHIRRKRVQYLLGDYAEGLKLPQTDAEGAMLKRIFSAQEIAPTLKDLKAALSEKSADKQFDLLHICCHGEAAGEEASQAQMFLNGELAQDDEIDGESLKAKTVQQEMRFARDTPDRRPIVVLNACESARPNREFNGMGGFAHAFVTAQVGAFIGTHWSVGDAPAFTFVEALYEEFAKKRSKPITLSQAVIKARAAARGQDDATWLAYVVYGHPHAKVTVE